MWINENHGTDEHPFFVRYWEGPTAFKVVGYGDGTFSFSEHALDDNDTELDARTIEPEEPLLSLMEELSRLPFIEEDKAPKILKHIMIFGIDTLTPEKTLSLMDQ